MSWLINQVSIEERTCKVDMLTFQVFPPWNLNVLFHTTSQDVYSFKSVLEVDLLGAEDELRSCKRVRGNLEKRKLAWRTGGRKLGETCCFLRFKNTSPSSLHDNLDLYAVCILVLRSFPVTWGFYWFPGCCARCLVAFQPRLALESPLW